MKFQGQDAKLIYIEWVDASSNSNWMSEEDTKVWIAAQNWLVKQVGWLLQEDKRQIVIAGRLEVDSCQLYGQLQKIPKTWIKKRKVLKV